MMIIDQYTSDSEILGEWGARIAHERVARNMTQAQMARESGLSKRTIERLETGNSSQTGSLIRVLRVLHLVDRLNLVIPEPEISPMELLKLSGKRRQRASSRRTKEGSESGWTWGDRS